MATKTQADRDAALREAAAKCEKARESAIAKLQAKIATEQRAADAKLAKLQADAQAETEKIAAELAKDEHRRLVAAAHACLESNGGRNQCEDFAVVFQELEKRSRALLPMSADLCVMQRTNRLLWAVAQLAASGHPAEGDEALSASDDFTKHTIDTFESSHVPGSIYGAAGAQARLRKACLDQSPSRVWHELGLLLEICERVLRNGSHSPKHRDSKRRLEILRFGGLPEAVERKIRELKITEDLPIRAAADKANAAHAAAFSARFRKRPESNTYDDVAEPIEPIEPTPTRLTTTPHFGSMSS